MAHKLSAILECSMSQFTTAQSISPLCVFICYSSACAPVHEQATPYFPAGKMSLFCLRLNESVFLPQVVPRPEISCEGPAQNAVLCGQEEIPGKHRKKDHFCGVEQRAWGVGGVGVFFLGGG